MKILLLATCVIISAYAQGLSVGRGHVHVHMPVPMHELAKFAFKGSFLN